MDLAAYARAQSSLSDFGPPRFPVGQRRACPKEPPCLTFAISFAAMSPPTVSTTDVRGLTRRSLGAHSTNSKTQTKSEFSMETSVYSNYELIAQRNTAFAGCLWRNWPFHWNLRPDRRPRGR